MVDVRTSSVRQPGTALLGFREVIYSIHGKLSPPFLLRGRSTK